MPKFLNKIYGNLPNAIFLEPLHALLAERGSPLPAITIVNDKYQPASAEKCDDDKANSENLNKNARENLINQEKPTAIIVDEQPEGNSSFTTTDTICEGRLKIARNNYYYYYEKYHYLLFGRPIGENSSKKTNFSVKISSKNGQFLYYKFKIRRKKLFPRLRHPVFGSRRQRRE